MHTTEIELSGYRAIIKKKLPCVLLGTTGSKGNETLRITRGTGWEGLTVKAVFHPQRIEVLLPESGTMDVPWEVTTQPLRPEQAGKIVFHGVDESTGRVLITNDLSYQVTNNHSPTDGTPPGTPTPSVWEQWVMDASYAAKELDALVTESKQLVDRAEAAANNAATNASLAVQTTYEETIQVEMQQQAASAAASAEAAKLSAEAAAGIADVGVDATLTTSGAAADAAATGKAVGRIKSTLNTLVRSEDTFSDLSITLESGYAQVDGSISKGDFYHVSLPVSAGEVYLLKCQTGANIRSFVVLNAGGFVTRAADSENWGTNHNYDVEVTIAEEEDGGTLRISTLDAAYIGARKRLTSTTLDPAILADGSIAQSKIKGLEDAGLSTAMFVDQYQAFAFTTDVGFMQNDGTLSDYSDCHYTKIEVAAGEKYRFFCTHGYSSRAYVLTDSAGAVYEYYPTDNVPAQDSYITLPIPKDGYLYINTYTSIQCIRARAKRVKECELYGKNILFFGDSITAGDGSWASLYGVPMRFNMEYMNLGIGGACFTTDDSSTASNNIYKALVASVASGFEPDYVVIQGGVNDAFQNRTLGEASDTNDFTTELATDTFSGAFEMAIRAALSTWPGKKIGFIANAKIPRNDALGTYLDRAKEICQKYSVPVLDLYNASGLCAGIQSLNDAYYKVDPDYSAEHSDGTHPTKEGYALYINDKVNAWLTTL
jgi:lysophospholipase L1-like esterase